MKLAKPGQPRSFAAYPRRWTDIVERHEQVEQSSERLEMPIPDVELDYVRMEEQLDGRLSVFVRELREQPPRRQFEIQFPKYGALRVTGEHAAPEYPECSGSGSLFLIPDSLWIREVGLGADSVYGGNAGYLHCVIFTASFTVDVATSRAPTVREVTPLSDAEFAELTSGPTRA
jgi:hypothetical protein